MKSTLPPQNSTTGEFAKPTSNLTKTFQDIRPYRLFKIRQVPLDVARESERSKSENVRETLKDVVTLTYLQYI